jgi:hypothetical protein
MVDYFLHMFDDIKEIFKRNEPTDEEKKIYSVLSTKEGQEVMSWIRKRTIEKQFGLGVQDGIQTAILTARELGRCDFYHELNKILIKVSLYVNGK